MKYEYFLQQNASAVFGLIGALGGATIASIVVWLGKKRDYDLRLWDKLLDRRIKAHEEVLAIALDLRIMVGLGGTEGYGEPARAPKILLSKDEFETWSESMTNRVAKVSSWLSTDVRRELNFVQDYFVTLYQHLHEVPSGKYKQVGQIVRQDFIDFSSALEKKAFAFFQGEVKELKLNNLTDWHKYPRPETKSRLKKTLLLSRWSEIENVLKDKNGPGAN